MAGGLCERTEEGRRRTRLDLKSSSSPEHHPYVALTVMRGLASGVSRNLQSLVTVL
jgi:hypothetical protein